MKRFIFVVCGLFFIASAYATTCDVGQFYDAGFCYSCPVNASCRDGETFTCDDGFYRNGAICNACPIQNSTCTDAENFSCNAGTYLKDGVCTSCPENATCPGGDKMFHCNDGYFRNTKTNDKCDVCGGATICENGERIKCAPGYRFYQPYGMCISCSPNYYCPDGEIAGCLQGYYFSLGFCYQCEENFFCPALEATSANRTQYCAAGYYHSMGTCVACDNDTPCPGGKPEEMTCPDGLRLHADGRCLAWPDTPGLYPDCNPGYYDDGGTCAPCPDGSVCSSASDFTCLAGHYKDNGKCNTCPPEATCNDADGIMCNPGYYLKNNSCVFCPAENYCQDNQLFECPQYVPGIYEPALADGESLYKATYIAAPYPAYKESQCILWVYRFAVGKICAVSFCLE